MDIKENSVGDRGNMVQNQTHMSVRGGEGETERAREGKKERERGKGREGKKKEREGERRSAIERKERD